MDDFYKHVNKIHRIYLLKKSIKTLTLCILAVIIFSIAIIWR